MNSTQSTIHMGQACMALRSDDEAKRLYLEAYSNAHANKWTPLLLNALISFADMPNGLSPETKLVVALSTLAHPALPPYLRERSEMIRDNAKASLSVDGIKVAENLAREKSPDLWAQELLK
jgi:hypothetical protein